MQADKQKSNNLDNMVLSPDVGLLVEKDIAPFLVGKSGGKIYLRMDEVSEVKFYLTTGINGNVKSGMITSVPSVISSSVTDATVSNLSLIHI